MKLKDFSAGIKVKGLVTNKTVEIISAKFQGDLSAEIIYKDDEGNLFSQMIFADQLENFSVEEKNLSWTFTADAENVRMASEAYRIHLAHIFDPYLAIHISSVTPLPHQISAVYEKMLIRQPLRFVLADDPGAGKTIMTGLLIKELFMRGDLRRCLIVCPGNLAEQWQDEMRDKFHMNFEILTNDRINSSVSGNIFQDINFCIAQLDKLARSEEIKKILQNSDWDLIVCDEAHKMSATVFGGEIKRTKRFQLGTLLRDRTRHFLLLTATPHNGKDEDFQLFMSLIDEDRFGGAQHLNQPVGDISDVMRRLVKEDLLKFDGKPLFPERFAYTVNYDLSEIENELYEKVTEYVKEEFNRAERLTGGRKNTVGFALTILQRRLASSPEAIYKSLERRTNRLKKLVEDEKQNKREKNSYKFDDAEDIDAFESASADEIESNEDKIVSSATAAQSIHEMEIEIGILSDLTKMAEKVRRSGRDKKWEELSKLLQENEKIIGQDNSREKLIIFTEHRDTLNYLNEKISSLLGRDEVVVKIHGSMSRDERRNVEEKFKHDKNVLILLATDAAGEGINLQRAHLMINYDLPWNPNRIEQRFGRIHRIGQTEVCHLWNLVASNTREGQVFYRLLKKLEEERNALGGKVFDILGKISFDNKSLSELLKEAVRYGNNPQSREYLNTVIDSSLDRENLQNLLTERALTEDILTSDMVTKVHEEMERMEVHKLQPHFIENFFVESFKRLGGKIYLRDNGRRYEITRVPSDIRNYNKNFGKNILQKYERICFSKDLCNLPGLIPAEYISPGHPLLETVSDFIRERYANDLKQGAIFIDDNDAGQEARLLFYVESSVQDDFVAKNSNQRRIISKRVDFVEMFESGKIISAGYAPYLDYRVPTEQEQEKIFAEIKNAAWLKNDIQENIFNYAAQNIVPKHLAEVVKRKTNFLNKMESAVTERLTNLVQYYDRRAGELKQDELLGKKNAKLNSTLAGQRAEEFAERLKQRRDEITLSRKMTAASPKIISGALIVPVGRLNAEKNLISNLKSRAAVEEIAMQAVIDIEKSLGFIPQDISAENRGYDIESFIPKDLRESENSLRFIEVKGRRADADTVTVTKNEILAALNAPNNFILAIVSVDGDKTKTIYLQNPFKRLPDFGAVSVNYKISELIQHGTIIFQ